MDPWSIRTNEFQNDPWCVVVGEGFEAYVIGVYERLKCIVNHIELPSIVPVGCAGWGSDYVTCELWANLSDFIWVPIALGYYTQNIDLCIGIKGPLHFPTIMYSLLLWLVADECISNFLEGYKSWILLVRDVWSCCIVMQDLCGARQIRANGCLSQFHESLEHGNISILSFV